MSHWAWSVALPPTPKLLLMALADIADDLGACWPSHPALAAKCNLSDRTVRRVLITLQAQELVYIEPRFKTNGSRTSNRYRLAVDIPQDNLSGAPATHGRGDVTDDQGPRTPLARGSGHPCPGPPDNDVLVTTTEPSLEPSQPPPPAPDRALEPESAGGGGDLCYPKNLTPRQRQALQERLTVLNRDQAQQILDELTGRMALTQVKNPLRYCATLVVRMQRREFKPELGLNIADRRQAAEAQRTAREQSEKSATGSAPVGLPVRFREQMQRIRSNASARSKGETETARHQVPMRNKWPTCC